jgi:hypothetical protein
MQYIAILYFILVVGQAPALSQGSKGDEPKASAVKDPALREELLRRMKVDQSARHALIELSKKAKPDLDEQLKLTEQLNKIDDENTAWLKGIVEKQGWPTITQAGNDGAGAAWLLVQHADLKPQFQRQCLDLMNKLPKNEMNGKNLAYLTDRVLLAEGKKQLYGTQFTQVDGRWKPRPLEDEANVDKRRAEAGLSTLAEYAKQLEKVYGGKK